VTFKSDFGYYGDLTSDNISNITAYKTYDATNKETKTKKMKSWVSYFTQGHSVTEYHVACNSYMNKW